VLGDLFEAPVVRVRRRLPNGAERRAKRVLDVVLSSLGLAVFALPMGAIALAIKLGSPARSSTARSASVCAVAASTSSSSAAWWSATTSSTTVSTCRR